MTGGSMLLTLTAQLPPWAQWPAVILAVLSTGALAIKALLAWWDRREAKVARDVRDDLHAQRVDEELRALRSDLDEVRRTLRADIAEIDRKVDTLAMGMTTVVTSVEGMRDLCAAQRGVGGACDPSTSGTAARLRSVTPARGLPVGVPTPADVPPVAAEKR